MNIRATLLSLALLLAVSVASTAGAVELSIQGPTSATIAPGGTFTIEIGLDNASLDNTPGFEAHVIGLAAAGADVTSGAAALLYLNQACFPGFGCVNGLATIDNTFYNPNDLSEHFTLGDDDLFAINVAGATFSANDGSIDLGVANDQVNLTPSPIDATIDLTATTVGVHTLTITGAWSDGTDVFDLPTSTFTLTVPEPGAMAASLAGLGTVFAIVGIRRRR